MPPLRRNNASDQTVRVVVVAAILAAVVVVVIASNQQPDTTPTQRRHAETTRPTPAAEWYQGGTLHQAKVSQWRVASYQNRLATSANFVMVLGKYDALPPDLRARATEFERAISTAVQDGGVDYKDVSEIAAACAVLMGY